MHKYTGFQRDLLYIIAGADRPHGLAVKELAEDYYPEAINHGRLYPNLDTLVDDGLVDKQSRDRRTNVYVLTKRGQEVIDERREWEEEHLSEDENEHTPELY